MNTNKTKWQHYNMLGTLKRDFAIPMHLDTDVNAACLGESLYGAGRNVDSTLYITVSTGIGAGLVHHGDIYQGKNHSDMGNVFIQQREYDQFTGVCPYHSNCLEGLASGTAIEKRHGAKVHLLKNDAAVWELEAYYLARAIANYMLILSPKRIILGGGVMKQAKLYPLIQENVREMVNNYIAVGDVDELIAAPELEDEQGIKGAMALVK
ncbi:ROK family protein [Virgibacillus litoralis]|uniref:fructokinase n=1 Tax=Virgibacillus litoralis TaxID=578221 RepID=A0ABS4HHZ7_9BACI|nr:fructokinase [Virgibacillus litoralis]